MRNRIFRLLVCLVLVCVILVNCSPIRAEAVVTEAVITGAAATGVAAVLFSMAMGVVFVDLTWQAIERMGAQMSSSVKAWGDANGKSNEVNEWLDGISISDAINSVLSIPADLMSGVTSWVASLINGGSIAVPKDGINVCLDYALLGLGSMPETLYSNCMIYLDDSGYYFVTCERGWSVYSDGSVQTYRTSSEKYYIIYHYADGTWVESHSGNILASSNKVWCDFTDVVWVMSDICKDGTNDILLYAADSTAAYTYVSPSDFVGAIPGEIIAGTTTADDVEILSIDYGIVFESGGSGDDENQDSDYRVLAGLNSLAGQLSDGSLSYDDYMEQTKVEEDIPDVSEPAIEPEPDVGGNDPVKSSNLKQWLDGIKDRMTLLLQPLASKVSNILDVVTGIPEALLNGIQRLFVPDAESMAAQQDKWTKLLSDRFGAVYDSVALIDNIAGAFTLGATQTQIRFPLITIPFADVNWEFGGWMVDVVPDGFQVLVDALKVGIDILCTLAFVNAMKHRLERVLEGRG